MTITEITTKLKSYHDLMEELLQLLTRRPIVNRPKLKELLSEIKTGLKEDYQSMSRVSYQKNMSSDEKAFLYPAIHETHTKIRVKVSSIPGPKWASEIYDAQSTISWYLDQLENNEP